MGRMMPGRIRQEGIELYEAGQLKVLHSEDGRLDLHIASERFVYGPTDTDLFCTCSLFQQKGYCSHLAATEYFLKNDSHGKTLLASLEDEGAVKEEHEKKKYLGGLFLDQVLSPLEDVGVKYQLATEGSLQLFDQQVDWTLKMRRLPDQRSYIIRDIGAFLRLVKQQQHYQIGKQYYEQVAYDYFDQPSQALLDFLWEFVPEKTGLDSDILVHFGRHFRLPQAYFEEGLQLLNQLEDFSFTYHQKTYPSANLVYLSAEAGLFHFQVRVRTRLIELIVCERSFRSLMGGKYLLAGSTFYRLIRQQEMLLKAIANLPLEEGKRVVQLDFQDKERLALSLLDFESLGHVEAPKKFRIRDFEVQFYLNLLEKNQLDLRLELVFKDHRVASQEALESLPFSYHYHHLDRVFAVMDSLGFSKSFSSKHRALSDEELYFFLERELPRLERMGRVELSENIQEKVRSAQAQVTVRPSGSLLDISFHFEGISQEEIQAAVQSLMASQDYFVSKTGTILVFDEESKRLSRTLRDLRAGFATEGQLQLGRLATYQVAEVFKDQANVHFSKDFQQLAYDLTHPEDFSACLPVLSVSLRDYQEIGFKWLSMLDNYGFGGILADDMGLGKTLQTIAFLASKLKKDSKVLILAPSSLLYNWQEEFIRFAPDLDVTVIYGSKEQREERIAEGHQVMISSYPSFRQDFDSYQSFSFDYLILDEAQVMKNAQTKIAKLLREFEVGNCFALSGTPIENQLTELWSIFQIVLPGLLPSKQDFTALSPQEVGRMIKPFVLRRRKEEVLHELPDLLEVTLLNELSDQQKAIYLAQLTHMQDLVAGVSDSEIGRRKIEILSGITRLRQICDTPSLFMEDYQGTSGKIDSLLELLAQLKEGQHRVLVFSQFRGMLDHIENHLSQLGLTTYKLTGSTPAKERQEMTQAFNAGSRDAFLISLKAGGVGLNLTGANRVILVDLWWNPAVEAQAISRAHRMGQTEKVECYRLITRGTIEEKILALQETKKDLVTTVLDGDEHRSHLTPDDIREILGITDGAV